MSAPFGINDRLTRLGLALLLAVSAGGLSSGEVMASQAAQSQPDEIRRQLERDFDLVRVTRGIVLTPKSASASFRSIEVSDDGTISVDGVLVSGAELASKVGASASAVLNLSYLGTAERRAIAERPAVPAPPPAPESPPFAPRDRRPLRFNMRQRNDGEDRVHIGGGVTVNAGEVVQGDAVAVGGPARVDGEVRGDVVSVGGNVVLGPQAIIGRNVVVVGGTLQRDPGAQVGGEVQLIGWGGMTNWWRDRLAPSYSWPFVASLGLVLQIVRISVLAVLALLVVLVSGNYVERISARATAEPLKAGAIGFLAQILFIPLLICVIVLLVVTIIGIPLLILVPFAILGLILVALVGFTAIAFQIGQLVSARLSWTSGPYAATLIGVIALAVPVILARIAGLGGLALSPISITLSFLGWLIEYVAWTIGFGAVALTRFSKATPPTPSTV